MYLVSPADLVMDFIKRTAGETDLFPLTL